MERKKVNKKVQDEVESVVGILYLAMTSTDYDGSWNILGQEAQRQS
jgi:hypothetical protein